MNRLAPLAVASILAVVGCSGGSASRPAASTAPASTTAPTTSSATAPPAPAPVPSAAPAALPAGDFTRTHAGREYRLHVPPNAKAPLPLVLCFHGAGDGSRNFFETLRVGGWLAAADKVGVALLVPASRSPYSDFANWTGNPNNDFAAMRSELDAVLALVDADVTPTWPIDPARTHGLGFSNGGLFLAVAGLPSARLATTTILGFGWGAFAIQSVAQKRPVHLACGTADGFYSRAQQSQQFLATSGHEVLWEPVANAPHSLLAVSAGIGPEKALAWIAARGATGAAPPPPAAPPPSTSPSTKPGGRGTITRPITTVARGGVPSVTSSYTAYVPAVYDPAKPARVVVATNVGLAPWQSLADAEGLIVVDFRDHDRNGGFDFGVDVARLDATLQDLEATWAVDAKRIYYHGFSAGAHWGYAVVLANGQTFAGLGISAGSLQVAAQAGVWPNGVTRKVPVAIRHGTQDTVVPASEGRNARAALAAAGHPVELGEFAGGHTVSAQDAQAIWAFLKGHALP